MRDLSLEELLHVSGGGDTYTAEQEKIVYEDWDRNGVYDTQVVYGPNGQVLSMGDIAGAAQPTNSLGVFDTTNTNGWANASGSVVYTSGGYGAYGFVGGFSHIYNGDTYGYVGIGTPGPSGSVGADLDGNLAGWAVELPAGHTSLIVDPTTGQVAQIETGLTGLSLTYSVNLSDIYRQIEQMAAQVASGFVQTYYPEQVWNPTYQPPMPQQ